jgi:hypothetical protein
MEMSLTETGESMFDVGSSGLTQRYFAIVAVGIFANILATGGCGPNRVQRADRAAVTGTVTYMGKPVSGGIVTFTSASNGATADCMLKSNGKFAVGDVPQGEVKVTIDPESIKPELGSRYVQLPAKYLSAQTSGLSFDVKPGDNTADFDLQ